MMIFRLFARVALFPVWAVVCLCKWVCVLAVSCSAMIFHLLAGIFFLTAVAGYAFGLENGASIMKSLTIAVGTFMIPIVAGVLLAGVEIVNLSLKAIVFGI